MKQTSQGIQSSVLGDLLPYANLPPFDDLCSTLPIEKYKDRMLSSGLYNLLFADNLQIINSPISFIDQAKLETSTFYYEEYIAKFRKIPSRGNWHDFFNALVWSQLPNTKSTFNQLHCQEIVKNGVKKRTPIRDRLTHFDECGLIIFTDREQLQQDCANHNWSSLFIKHKSDWKTNAEIIIVGHAIWEMLMNPFIGLTGKAMFIELPSDALFELSNDLSRHEYQKADYLINEHLLIKNVFNKNRPWLPLPILGIPDWSVFPQTREFYSNTKYFMPKRLKSYK